MWQKTGPDRAGRGKGGVKRGVLTDGQGPSLPIVAAPGNGHDMKLAAPSLAALIIEPAEPHLWRRLCMNLGHYYQALRNRVWEAGMAPWIEGWPDEIKHRRRNEAPARRRAVEHTHSWLNQSRRLLVRWEKREVIMWPGRTSHVL